MLANRMVQAMMLGAVLTIPAMTVAQPYTMLVTFTQPLVDGPDDDTNVDNPIVPIAPPTTPGTYGLATFVARGGPGVGAIAVPGFVVAGGVRIYVDPSQIEKPTAPAGVSANILSLGRNATPRGVTIASTISGPHDDATSNFDKNPSTTAYFVVGSFMGTNLEPKTNPLAANNNFADAKFRLPLDWTLEEPNHAVGTFEVFQTVNIVVKPTATFPLHLGITNNPHTGGLTSARLDNSALMGTSETFVGVATGGLNLPPIVTATPTVRAAGLSVQIESLDAAPSFVAYFVKFGNNFVYQGDSGWFEYEEYDVTFPNWTYGNLPLKLQAFGGTPGGGVATIYPIGSTTLNGTVARGAQ